MTRYEISKDVVDLSTLTNSGRNALLSPLIGESDKVICLCNQRRLTMHVSRRGGNYFPVKEKNTGEHHDKLCRHHDLTTCEAAAMGYTLGAIRNSSDEELIVTLAKPLKKGSLMTTISTSTFEFNAGPPRPVTNRMTELGLLHLLWERARLHEYSPPPNVGTLWPKLRQASYGLRPSGIKGLENGLSDLLLLPIHAETQNQADRNFAKFKDAQEKNRFVLFVARLNTTDVGSLLAAVSSDFSLHKIFGVNLSLYADSAQPLLNAIKTSFNDELIYSQTDGDDLIVLGIAQPSTNKNYAKISSMVLMPVVAEHVPYDSRYEKQFALELVRQDRSFKKPLRYEAVRDMQVHPDFVFLDTPDPVVVEVYGMSTPDYLARKAEKQVIYHSLEYPFACWEWDAVKCNDLTRWLEKNPLPGL